MTNHPITPPPELVRQWRKQAPVARDGGAIREQWIATQAARWGADQRLEAIRQLLEINGCPSKFIDLIINARRPKPPSLKQQALYQVESFACSMETLGMDVDTIRRALEALSDE